MSGEIATCLCRRGIQDQYPNFLNRLSHGFPVVWVTSSMHVVPGTIYPDTLGDPVVSIKFFGLGLGPVQMVPGEVWTVMPVVID